MALIFGSKKGPSPIPIRAFGSSSPEKIPRGRWYLKDLATNISLLASRAEQQCRHKNPVDFSIVSEANYFFSVYPRAFLWQSGTHFTQPLKSTLERRMIAKIDLGGCTSFAEYEPNT